jgi:hypothetical protein
MALIGLWEIYQAGCKYSVAQLCLTVFILFEFSLLSNIVEFGLSSKAEKSDRQRAAVRDGRVKSCNHIRV